MLRVPEHYAHFGAHSSKSGWPATDTDGHSLQNQPADLLRKVRKLVLWAVFGAPVLVVMAVWQFVDPADPNYGHEQQRD